MRRGGRAVAAWERESAAAAADELRAAHWMERRERDPPRCCGVGSGRDNGCRERRRRESGQR